MFWREESACCWQVWGWLLQEPRELAKNTDALAPPAASEGALGGVPGDCLSARGALGIPLLQSPPSQTTWAPPRGLQESLMGKAPCPQPASHTDRLNSHRLPGRARETGGSNGAERRGLGVHYPTPRALLWPLLLPLCSDTSDPGNKRPPERFPASTAFVLRISHPHTCNGGARTT